MGELELPCTIPLEGQDFAQVEKQVSAWKALGATSIYLDTMNHGLEGPDAHIKVASEFRSLFDT